MVTKHKLRMLLAFIAMWASINILVLRESAAAEQIATVSIMNVAVSQCLDAYQSGGRSGKDVKLKYCNGSVYQQWILEKVSYYYVGYHSGFVRFRNAAFPHLCLDVKQAKYVDRNPVWLYTCWPNSDDRIGAQLFDAIYSFYHEDYSPFTNAIKQISIEKVFSGHGKSMVTWIRPVFGQKVFDVAGGKTNGDLQLYKPHADLLWARPHNSKPNQLFAIVKAR